MKKSLIVILVLALSIVPTFSVTYIGQHVYQEDREETVSDRCGQGMDSFTAGACLLGSTIMELGLLGGYLGYTIPEFGESYIEYPGLIIGGVVMGVASLATLIPGLFLTIMGNQTYKVNVKALSMLEKAELYKSKYHIYKMLAMPFGITCLLSTCTLVPGVALLAMYQLDKGKNAFFDPTKEVNGVGQDKIAQRTGGILAISGLVGLAITLPMTIAMLSISAWCKGKALEVLPDVAIVHDDKCNDFTTGYGVSLGARIRL